MENLKLKSMVLICKMILLLFITGSCGDDDVITPVDVITDTTTVDLTIKEKATFNIGAAVKTSYLQEAEYASTFNEHFNQISAEYEMKMEYIWAESSTSYNWDAADELVDYASDNDMEVHGHTLVWYNSFPDWFKNAEYDSATFEDKVKVYITTVVSRYKGKVISWDVVNEIFDDNGGLREDETVFVTFNDPIAFYGRCFQYARDADPDVKLFYNDYSLAISAAKRYGLLSMLDRFEAEGYPIDGIGDQFHYKTSTDETTMKTGVDAMAATGLLVHISELDIVVNVDKSDSYVFSTAEQDNQADTYQAIVEMYEAIPDAQKFAITTWGITDKYTWLTGWWHELEYPLLFDDEYEKKEAYQGFMDGLN